VLYNPLCTLGVGPTTSSGHSNEQKNSIAMLYPEQGSAAGQNSLFGTSYTINFHEIHPFGQKKCAYFCFHLPQARSVHRTSLSSPVEKK